MSGVRTFSGKLAGIWIAASLVAIGVGAWSCKDSNGDSLFNDGLTGKNDGGTGDDPGFVVDGGSGADGRGCVGLECKRASCPGGGTTTLSGTVLTPRAGDPDPVYNAIVYVPNAPVEPFSEGVSCDRCGAAVSGHPIAVATTGIDGKFVLKDVPVSDNLPLVVQLGRWRRQVVVPSVTACGDTPLAAELTRFPRNQHEGDIPKMALKSGDSDSPECVLRKMGVDDAEFTNPDAGGRIEVFKGALFNPPVINGSTPPQANLVDNAAQLAKYDIVLLPCDGQDFTPSTTSAQNLEAYADLGGRIFSSHYSYNWIKSAPAPWSTVATWNVGAAPPAADASVPGYIQTGFPKGLAMSQWLQNLQAADGGVIASLLQPRRDVNTISGDATEWVGIKGPDEVDHFTFNTPIGIDAGAQCGRVVFNDFHTVNVFGGQTGTYPAECGDKAQPLTPQERVFEFLLFDLSSCVQNDDQAPIPPPVIK